MSRIPRAIADRVPDDAKARYLDLLHRVRWRRYAVRRVTNAVVRQHGRSVLGGPFTGMRFPEFAVGRGELVVPQLLGAYEAELHPVIEEVVAGGFERIVDVGASDGYYAVGLAVRSPQSTVVAYEMNPFPARVCRAMAQENGVAGRIDLRGECTVEELAALGEGPRTFLLCDAEGAEAVLMDPEKVPLLRSALLLVELHEFAAVGIEDTLRRRFEPTHEIEIVERRLRHAADYPPLMQTRGIDYMDRELALAEFRWTPIRWAVMRPRAG